MSETISYILKSSAAQTLGAMASILAKAKAHAATAKVDEAVYLAARVFPDMHPLTRQVQIACDVAARGAARLASKDVPSFPDTEATFDELIERCKGALAFVNTMPDEEINVSERVTLQIPMGPDMMPMEGRQYLSSFILPNLHFHAAIMYSLLRSQGVAIGKRDFLVPG